MAITWQLQVFFLRQVVAIGTVQDLMPKAGTLGPRQQPGMCRQDVSSSERKSAHRYVVLSVSATAVYLLMNSDRPFGPQGSWSGNATRVLPGRGMDT